jgi:TatD DNase family protein
MLIDTHAHLSEVNTMEIEDVLSGAHMVGVERVIAVGMALESNRKTLALAKRFPHIIYPAVGYHPWEIDESQVETEITFIAEKLKDCVALGEVGLDYKVKIPKKVQWRVFDRLLDLAVQFDKPVIVHSRFSHQRSVRMIAAAGIKKAVFHWFSGPLDILSDLLDGGYFVSATPALKYSPSHRAAIQKAPLARILIETDTPVAYQNEISSPANLVDTLALLGDLKGIPVQEVANITTANAESFFGLSRSMS